MFDPADVGMGCCAGPGPRVAEVLVLVRRVVGVSALARPVC